MSDSPWVDINGFRESKREELANKVAASRREASRAKASVEPIAASVKEPVSKEPVSKESVETEPVTVTLSDLETFTSLVASGEVWTATGFIKLV